MNKGKYIMGMFDEKTYIKIIEAKDVTPRVLEIAEEVFTTSFDNDGPIDWEDFFDDFEKYPDPLGEDTEFDFGPQIDTPAMRKIQKHVRAYRALA